MATDLMRNERGNQGLGAVVSQLAALWDQQSRLRRLIAVAVLVVVVVGGGWSVLGSGRPTWTTVVSARYDGDAHECLAELQHAGIAAQLRGRDVEVATADLASARAALAAAGLPDPSLGRYTFENASLMRSSVAEQASHNWALQDELARSIKELAPIDRARVNLAVGRPSLYKGQGQAPSASVVLRVRPGQVLSPAQVRGIQQLVASGVNGLRVDAVSVVDSHGALLESGDGEIATRQLDVEHTIGAKVRAILEPVTGPGRVAVVVSADLDLRQVEETAETYDRERAAATVEPGRLEEGRAPTAPTAPRAPTEAPPPGPPGAAAGAAGTSASSSDPPSRVVTATRFPPARLQRLQLAVVVDYRRGSNGTAVAPTEAELALWAGLVRNAAGIDERRGDRLELRAAAFAPVPELEPPTPGAVASPTSLAELVPALGWFGGLAVLGALAVVLLLAVATVAWLRHRYARRAAAAERRIAELQWQAAAPARSPELDGVTGASRLSVEPDERVLERVTERALERATEAARADLHGTALVLSTWLAEREAAPPGAERASGAVQASSSISAASPGASS